MTAPCPACQDPDVDDFDRDRINCDERCRRGCKGHCQECGGTGEIELEPVVANLEHGHTGPLWGWGVSYETAVVQAGICTTRDDAERMAARHHDELVFRGLNPDALAYHVRLEAA